jgi:hypothetical protein
MSKIFKVKLEDIGQDLLSLTVNEKNEIIDCENFGPKLYIGGYIPIEKQKIGDPCMIHYPPNIKFGFLKYNVLSIEEVI